jgi:hypothetical protein
MIFQNLMLKGLVIREVSTARINHDFPNPSKNKNLAIVPNDQILKCASDVESDYRLG